MTMTKSPLRRRPRAPSRGSRGTPKLHAEHAVRGVTVIKDRHWILGTEPEDDGALLLNVVLFPGTGARLRGRFARLPTAMGGR
ncbi:hypothetical protein GGR03_001771 [Aurantimonas endophytica]|uniref:Uncharacterized protein n=1 Tax=Aurantimonas endophytica TaxID=1522175 RepID=A0A7W6HCL7_9HYPH|nr:hypothetical protein [Aurantimonas endophytica]